MMMMLMIANLAAAVGVLVMLTAHILPHPANLLCETANLPYPGANLLCPSANLRKCVLEHAQSNL